MKFFNRLKKNNVIERKAIIDIIQELDVVSWKDVFSACLGKMMIIQNAVSKDVVRGRDWNVDFTKQTISFGNDEFPIQFIGSESISSNTWLWGWENVNHFDDRLLQLVYTTKSLGTQWHLEELMNAELELNDTINGHNLAIITCGLSSEELCYYRGPHAHGAILISVSNLPKSVFEPIDAHTFISTTMQCIQGFSINHKIFVESLLSWNGTAFEYHDDELMAHFKQDVIISFEMINNIERIKNMNTVV